jgi:hypothetical protein
MKKLRIVILAVIAIMCQLIEVNAMTPAQKRAAQIKAQQKGQQRAATPAEKKKVLAQSKLVCKGGVCRRI